MTRGIKAEVCAVLLVLTLAIGLTAAAEEPVSLYVDATDIGRKLFHSELAIPVRPGPLTLVYPKWIPGYHAPVGPLNNMVRLKMSGNGRPVEWKRDRVDMFAFHVVVPAGVTKLNIAMDVVAPTQPDFDFGAASARLFVLEWNEVVLYPDGAASDEVSVHAQVRLPAEWKYACAIPAARAANGLVELPEVSLKRLVDSPLLSGEYFKTVKISSGPAPVYLDMAADNPEALEITPQWEAHFRRLVAEAEAPFGRPHYEQYHFLLALSDELGDDGVEHRECSDNRVGARIFSDNAVRLSYGYLFPHEYAHAWNGKYRYPQGLATRNFQQPQTDELLWVYEGLTRYLNWVLAVRSGILTPEEAHDYAAILAAGMDHRSGREWRSLEDTSISAPLLSFAPEKWQSLRRSVDYYDESLFIWLEADTIIRRQTQGKQSLDNFCRAFLGAPMGAQQSAAYSFDDVVATLNSVAQYDWAKFFETRLSATGTDHAPLNGLTASGWDLAYGDTVGSVEAARDEVHKSIDERFSLGLVLRQDGSIVDVIRDSAAWKAGLGPGMKVIAVDGRTWSSRALRDAIGADRQSKAAIAVLVQNGSAIFQAAVDDHRGTRYPRLERNAAPDLMSDILRPRTLAGVAP